MSQQMSCPFQDQLWALWDGELASEEARGVERHRDGCGICQSRWSDLALASDALLSSRSQTVLPGGRAGVLRANLMDRAALDADERWSWWRRLLARLPGRWAATAARLREDPLCLSFDDSRKGRLEAEMSEVVVDYGHTARGARRRRWGLGLAGAVALGSLAGVWVSKGFQRSGKALQTDKRPQTSLVVPAPVTQPGNGMSLGPIQVLWENRTPRVMSLGPAEVTISRIRVARAKRSGAGWSADHPFQVFLDGRLRAPRGYVYRFAFGAPDSPVNGWSMSGPDAEGLGRGLTTGAPFTGFLLASEADLQGYRLHLKVAVLSAPRAAIQSLSLGPEKVGSALSGRTRGGGGDYPWSVRLLDLSAPGASPAEASLLVEEQTRYPEMTQGDLQGTNGWERREARSEGHLVRDASEPSTSTLTYGFRLRSPARPHGRVRFNATYVPAGAYTRYVGVLEGIPLTPPAR
ncbi:MAG TPA: anti-sigma factor [Armatimonadota bacterium]|jgi:hypothetical protein